MTPSAEWQLNTQHLGRRVLVYNVIDSTNSRCAALAGDPENAGLVLLAHAQSAGRGQHGRRWLCEAGTGVLMSALLFPPEGLRRPALLTAWAAVAVCDLIEELTGLVPRLKWPNDVLIDGRKVCGILIEQKRGVIAGIGLNLNQSRESFLADDLTEAGSLRLFTGQIFDVEATARQLICRLDDVYQHLIIGNLATVESRWKDQLGLVGKMVQAEGYADTWTGKLLDMSFDAVVMDTDAAGPLMLTPEEVRHIIAIDDDHTPPHSR